MRAQLRQVETASDAEQQGLQALRGHGASWRFLFVRRLKRHVVAATISFNAFLAAVTLSNIRGAIFTGLVLCLATSPALATNGLNLIGFGAESLLMGGTDLAVARDTSALNTNPAGLTQIVHRVLDSNLTAVYAIDVGHRDRFGSDVEVENDVIGLGGFGYAQRLAGSGVVVGVGLFGQGGAGYVYDDLDTAFGTRDDLSALFRIAKLSPGVAYRVNEALSLGASLAILYADFEQEFFPDTSAFNPADPAQSFFGVEIDGVYGVHYGYKLGVRYKLSGALFLAAAYTAKVELPLEGDELISNQSAIGLGKVRYRDVRLSGLALPQEIGLGLAWRPSEPWLLSFEVSWLDWSGALRNATVRAAEPDDPGAPPVLTRVTSLDWRDQYVFGLGAAFDWKAKTRLYAGYNYGRNPIPSRTLNPLLATITEHHVTFGFGRQLGTEWQLLGGVEYLLGNEVTYTNPELPFGPGAEERSESIALHLTLSRRW